MMSCKTRQPKYCAPMYMRPVHPIFLAQYATSMPWRVMVGILVSLFFLLQCKEIYAMEEGDLLSYDQFTQQLTQLRKQSAQPAQNLQTYTTLHGSLVQLLQQNPIHRERFFQESGQALWPSQQSTTHALMHYVFFPHGVIEDIYEIYGGAYQAGHWSIATRSTLISLTFAATYGGNPVAMFYLGEAFHHTSLCESPSCPQAGHIYQVALRIFVDTTLQEAHPLQEVAYYYLARFYQPLPSYSYLLPQAFLARAQALKLLSRTSLPQAQLLRLSRRLHLSSTQTTKPTPTLEDFENLQAQTNYSPISATIYEKFSKNMSSTSQVQLLTQLLKTKPHPVLHQRLAQIYLAHPTEYDLKTALEHLKYALECGSTTAYEQLLSQYAPSACMHQPFNLSTISDDCTYNLCHTIIQTMAKLGYPDAFYHLYVLHKARTAHQQKHPEPDTPGPQQDDRAIQNAYLIEAARHGLWKIYRVLPKHFKRTALTEYPCLDKTREQLYTHFLASYPDTSHDAYCAYRDLESLLDAIPDTVV